MSEEEVLDLQDNNPPLLERALYMESNADLVTIKGLGVDVSWKQIIEYDRAQLAMLPKRPRRVPCECTDGE